MEKQQKQLKEPIPDRVIVEVFDRPLTKEDKKYVRELRKQNQNKVRIKVEVRPSK